MEINTENTLPDFKAAFEDLPFWKQKQLRKEIMFRCDWKSRTTFLYKLNGQTPIKLPERAVIRQLFKNYGIDVNVPITEPVNN